MAEITVAEIKRVGSVCITVNVVVPETEFPSDHAAADMVVGVLREGLKGRGAVARPQEALRGRKPHNKGTVQVTDGASLARDPGGADDPFALPGSATTPAASGASV